MKVKIKEVEKEFKPFKLELKFESSLESHHFMSLIEATSVSWDRGSDLLYPEFSVIAEEIREYYKNN